VKIINPYDVSHYRTGDRENPSMHVYLKDTKNSGVVRAENYKIK
jgi:hypothetical protein